MIWSAISRKDHPAEKSVSFSLHLQTLLPSFFLCLWPLQLCLNSGEQAELLGFIHAN